jgi:hypothetical protein
MQEAKHCSKCQASMKSRISFFGDMVVMLYDCTGCKSVSAVTAFPETLDVKLVKRKMGYTKHFEQKEWL